MTSSEHTTPPAGPPDGARAASTPPQIAVWYFIAATFVFAAPSIWLPDIEPWARIAIIACGLLLVVLGGIRLGGEMAARRSSREDPPTGPESRPEA